MDSDQAAGAGNDLRERIEALLNAAPASKPAPVTAPNLRDPDEVARALWRLPPEVRWVVGRDFWVVGRDLSHEDWWMLLPRSVRAEIDQAIRPFWNFTALYKAHVSSEGAVIGAGSAEYLTWLTLPRLRFSEFQALLKRPPAARSRFAEEFGRRTAKELKRVLRIDKHRPSEHECRDWQLAKWLFEENVKPLEARRRWLAGHPEDARLTVPAIRQVKLRIRERFKSDQWDRRLYTYLTNFPRLASLNCPVCDGKGEVPNPAWNPWRREVAELSAAGDEQALREKVQLIPEDPSQLDCVRCKGTGRVPLKP